MEFFLPFQIPSFPFSISYADKILFIGSCFSEEIGNKMKTFKFDVLQNPNGILYDPESIADALLKYVQLKTYKEEDLFELNGLWHSWKHHSAFSAADKNEVLKNINGSLSRAHAFLKEAKFLIITLGTAFHYQLKINNANVANCHKAPADFFTKELLDINKIKNSLSNSISALMVFNPELKIIFTISPVKHVRDGVVQNLRSKSRLIEASHAIIKQNKNSFYFPSYELVTEVLRDYRFYKNDLVHPNETAVDYVFSRFCNSLLNESSRTIMKEVKAVLSAVNHKPFFKESAAHQKFIKATLKQMIAIENQIPLIDFSKEKKVFLE